MVVKGINRLQQGGASDEGDECDEGEGEVRSGENDYCLVVWLYLK